MEHNLYPKLHDYFRDGGVCPICLSEMTHGPKYICDNQHTLCYRCKIYYYGCPTCHHPLELVPPPELDQPQIPPPVHFVPHQIPPSRVTSIKQFLMREKTSWAPPTSPDQELIPCRYHDLGCWAKVPEMLSDVHEIRCQFRPFLEEEHLPTDLPLQDELLECRYASAGCKVTMPEWRKRIHEEVCSFKGKHEALEGLCDDLNEPVTDAENRAQRETASGVTFGEAIVDLTESEGVSEEPECDGDPEELVECKFAEYGCLVRMPRRRKLMHQEKCNYRKYDQLNDDQEEEVAETEPEIVEEAEEEKWTDCRWAEYGCLIRPKERRKHTHEAICNYRMEECAYRENGCNVTVHPAGKYAHERVCEFAN